MYRLLLILFFGSLCFSVHAAAISSPMRLAKAPLWLDLLHFNQGSTWHGRHESFVNDPDFFLAENGSRDPLAELQADIAAFSKKGDTERCRFPARYHFIAKRLGWHKPHPFAACTDFLKWRQRVPEKQVVVAFPAAYLNSPSSMFGHLFLRLDKKVDPKNVYTSWAVSFAARTDPSDNAFYYAFQGIVGSYPGYFSVGYYADKLHKYNNMESRDIWEYRLNLTPEERSRLVNHLWELRHIRFKYYFFDENCAFSLLGLLQVARPDVPLLQKMRFAEVPVTAIQELSKKGFVDHVHYRPSKEKQLRWESKQLPSSLQSLAKALAQDPSLKTSNAFTELDKHSKYEVANLAYHYLRYQNRKGKRQKAEAGHSYALLRLIQANSPARTNKPVPVPTPPDKGHGAHMASLAAGQRQNLAFTDIRLRYAYHDWLDNSAGFLRGAEIKGLDLDLRTYVNKPDERPGAGLRLHSLQIVDIRSLAPRDRLIKPISWFVDAGLEQVHVERQHLAGYLQGGPGLAWDAGHFIPYIYLKARLENNNAYTPFIETGGGSNIGLLYFNGRLSTQINVTGVYFDNSDWRSKGHVGLNWALGQNDAVRASFDHERYRYKRINEWSLSWRHYF